MDTNSKSLTPAQELLRIWIDPPRLHAHGNPVIQTLRLAEEFGLEMPASFQMNGLSERTQSQRLRQALIDFEFDRFRLLMRKHLGDVLFLKGADFIHRYYSHRQLRPLSDIDVLIRPGQFDLVCGEMKNLGYRVLAQDSKRKVVLAHLEGNEVPIEIHSAIPPYYNEEDQNLLWGRSEEIRLPSNESIRVLRPLDALIYGIWHAGIQHRLDTPIWLVDLWHLSKGLSDSDWEELSRASAKKEMKVSTWFILRMIKDEFPDSSISESLLNQLESRVSPLRRRVLNPRRRLDYWFSGNPRSSAQILWDRLSLRDRPLSYFLERMKTEESS